MNDIIVIKLEGMFQYFLRFNQANKIEWPSQKIIFKLNRKKDSNPQKIETTPKTETRVKFSNKTTMKIMYVWSFAHQQARTDKWQQIARDNTRFGRRIIELEKIIAPILRKKQLLSIHS